MRPPPIDGLVVDEGEATLDGLAPVATFSHDQAYRYTLSRRWDPEGPVASFVMLNPSTATAFDDDPTIRRCVSFARGWGCAGLLVLNLFAYRSTDPLALARVDDPVGPYNDLLLSVMLRPDRSTVMGPVVAAWGNHGRLQGRGRAVTDMLTRAGVQLRCLGTTGAGEPCHPLYLAKTTPLCPYPPVPVVADASA